MKRRRPGDNRAWLLRMLREVHTMEAHQHRNIVDYKHAWIENHRMTAFGPEVPVLFILMEFANGGTVDTLLHAPSSDEVRGHRLTLALVPSATLPISAVRC